jgi:hypothetical protein
MDMVHQGAAYPIENLRLFMYFDQKGKFQFFFEMSKIEI